LTSPSFLTSLRSCNGHAPLIIQEGRARAGQRVQPHRVGHCATPNSSLALGMVGGGGKVSVALTQSHSVPHSLTLLVFFPYSVFSPPRFSTNFEVVQRARPSYNPKGTCPRWAKSPAAPGGPMHHTQQFLSTSEGGERERYIVVGKVSLSARSRTSLSHTGLH
jgi:hypothetical protein